MKYVYRVILTILFMNITLYSVENIMESQPEVVFQFDKLEKSQENLALQIDFNKAVLHLNRNEFIEAIELFQKTSKILEVPSYLNMGIAYNKLGLNNSAKLYLNKVYENEDNIKNNTFSFMSASYYLYQMTKDNKYLDSVVKAYKKYKNVSEPAKRMAADTYVILKDYENALSVLNTIDSPMDLKKGLIYIKLNEFDKAEYHLKRAKDQSVNSETMDRILWMLSFVQLRLNKLEPLKENLDAISEKKATFKANVEFPLEIYFNKNKFNSKQYFDSVSKFDDNRKIDFIFYFAPFIFSDSQEIIYDSVKGFVYNQQESISNLEEMLKYNSKFLEISKKDPIIRVIELKKLLNKDTKSYVYYNLGLSSAQINDFYNAFKYFEKAYKLNPGNKLYSSMYLITANRINIKVKDSEYVENVLKSSSGSYNYFGKELYRLFINHQYTNTTQPINYESTIFYKALSFYSDMQENKPIINHPLLDEHFKDPLTFLIRLIQRQNGESDYSYYARLQDSVPLTLNDNFLDGPLIITKFYVDILKGLGLFASADLRIVGNKTPSYLRIKALVDLHQGRPNESIKTLEYLQNEYKLEDKYTMYLMVAGLLEAKRYNDALMQITLIKTMMNDADADFLTAIQLMQELKISSAKQFFNQPYLDSFIDFKLGGFDDYLESL